MNKLDIHEFKFTEMVNDSKGRTSPTKFIGVVSCLISLFLITLSGSSILLVLWFTSKSATDYGPILGAFQNVINQSVMLFTLGTALLATNRLSKDRELPATDEPKTSE